MRRTVARVLLVLGAAWLAVLLVAAITGGFTLGPLSVTTAKPLRFALLTLVAGALLLPVKELPRRALLSALGFAALYGIGLRLTRWLAFDNAAFDLTLFESTLHHTLQGNFMHAWGLNRPLFSEHFEPIVLFHLPLYALVRHSAVLQLTESLAVTFAAVPLYRCARVLGLDARIAALVAAAYLLNPFVWAGNRDFHPEMFGPLVVFTALHASLTRRWLKLYVALFFALCLKEEMALVMLCFAPLVLRGPEPQRRWPHALAVGARSLVWGVVAFKLVMPASHPAEVELHPLASRWSHLGATYPQMALGLLSRPGWTVGLLFQEAPLTLFTSLGFVPLADPLGFLAALPPLYLHLTGDYETASKLVGYYGIFATTLLFVATLFGLQRIQKKLSPNVALAAALLPVLALPTLPFFARPTQTDLHAAAFIEHQLPKDAVVCAQSPLAPHLTPDAKTLKLIPYCEGATFVLLAKHLDRWPLLEAADYDTFVEATLAKGVTTRFHEGGYLFLQTAGP
ncbi:MAG: DUF2079 domain-containing protein [Myxococcaceae bacterium]|nr:DUF2079 domain-containing protein [Myxococcaceae bacterium]